MNMDNAVFKYRIYGKLKTQKKFKPFDAEKNQFVTNLIYASMFYAHDIDKLRNEVDYMNINNPAYIFEIRNI
jgi:hypothetical protein